MEESKKEFPQALRQIAMILKEHCKDFVIIAHIDDQVWDTYSTRLFASGACLMEVRAIDRSFDDEHYERRAAEQESESEDEE